MYNYPNMYNYQPQPFTPPQQPMQQQTNKIFVAGIDDVNMRMQPINSEMIYLDNEKSILYQKTVDSTGHFSVKMFDIVEHIDTPKTPQVEYVSKEEFESKIQALADKISKGGNVTNGNGTSTNISRQTNL